MGYQKSPARPPKRQDKPDFGAFVPRFYARRMPRRVKKMAKRFMPEYERITREREVVFWGEVARALGVSYRLGARVGRACRDMMHERWSREPGLLEAMFADADRNRRRGHLRYEVTLVYDRLPDNRIALAPFARDEAAWAPRLVDWAFVDASLVQGPKEVTHAGDA